ncbi:hypothetical protein Rsub_08647 [Raphidocelis subcapitata]|uniref:Matrin-type domain-containing protein n=1 Tax=Raphidocelis subcapitata TaxID=307507 RepID=A0A2V0PEZ7_9CHLO|nr:hypothetical protein Rsub_08647 [Raphidocelis subcapitata]|eukprot:GBF95665.1 hypothetical protein Rsub_08647 [Raphidocelis subcapitata]
MTDRWKSNPMHWCDLCKCWMNDSKSSILNHERGAKHQESLAKKLREMAKKADADKIAAKQLAEALGSIEATAAAAYARDQEAAAAAEHAAAAAAAAATGVWEWDAASGYYYNEPHRWYFDPKTRWYYGGEPVAWAQDPPAASLPAAARFGTAPHAGGPEPPFKKPAAGAAAGSGSGAGAKAGGGGGGGVAVTTVKKVVALPQHPQSLIGGHQMHHVGGRIGGAKGVGEGGEEGAKRKRDEGAAGGKGAPAGKGGKPMDPAEAAALARREAARQRVQQRTQQAFGLS